VRLDAPQAPAHEAADISAWLLTLRKVLRLPEGEAAAILDELEDHLQQRTRDLQLSGIGDAEAVRMALNELGDAAMLARRFRSVNGFKRRRLAMNFAVLGVACGAAVLSILAVSRGPQGSGSGSGSVALYEDAYQPDRGGTKLSFDGAGEIELGKFLDVVGKDLQVPVYVRWERLQERGVENGTSVVIVGKGLELAEAFRRINETPGVSDAKLDYRVEHGILEVADREFFDRRERMLASYDLSSLMAGNSAEDRQKIANDLRGTIMQFVSRDDWQENGGDLAVLSTVDARLFVEAPPRMHKQVKWILEQLTAEARAQEPHANGAEETKIYPLKHTSASEVLAALRSLEAIKEIDLSRFAVDERTNSVIGAGDASVHHRIAGALAVLDRVTSERVVDGQGVPVLSDIPLVGELYKRP
jgi:hypothetical protein